MEPSNNINASLFPLATCPPISDEAFNSFHNIDRELYARLIHNLGRDPAESMQVMALWIWLERQCNDKKLIARMLSLPPLILHELAEEAVACLRCAENDAYPFGDGNHHQMNEITLLPDLLSNRVVSLRFFHENRIAVLRGVSRVINTVCSRAFRDILQRSWHAVGEVGESSRMGESRNAAAPIPILYHPVYNVPLVPLPPAVASGLIRMPMPMPPQIAVRPPPMAPVQFHVMEGGGGFPVYDVEAQRQMLGGELGELLSQNLAMGGGHVQEEVEEEIQPDDRTIFLTFSKGYPISEDEVREFFTRRFGDFIEDLIMQEVDSDEQPLYARMVARSPSVIDGIVGGNRAKYSINGKHVWARKYVKKPRSPPRDGGSPSSGAH